jgi:general secretion pathway protein K
VSRRREGSFTDLERGVVLVAAVTALALMSVLALGLAETTVLDERLAEKSLAALQADALARSGVAVAAVVLAETGAGAPDTLGAPWAVDVGRQPLGPGWVEVQVEDEARRLDLNAPELADAVPRLLALLGLDPGLADALADWTDADDVPRPRGAERDWYLAQTPPLVPRNAPFASVGELALVRGIDTAALTRLRPFVTVAGEHAVNPNTASREVLLAVVQDAATVDRLLAGRGRGPLAAEEIAALLPDAPSAVRLALTSRGQHYTVRAAGGVGAVRRTVEATLAAPGGVEPEIVAWRAVEG